MYCNFIDGYLAFTHTLMYSMYIFYQNKIYPDVFIHINLLLVYSKKHL